MLEKDTHDASRSALEHRALTNNGEFLRFVNVASFRDGQWKVGPHSNHVAVTAYRGDMKTWNDVVRRFDTAEPVAPHEPPPRGSISDASADRTLDSLSAPDSGGGR